MNGYLPNRLSADHTEQGRTDRSSTQPEDSERILAHDNLAKNPPPSHEK